MSKETVTGQGSQEQFGPKKSITIDGIKSDPGKKSSRFYLNDKGIFIPAIARFSVPDDGQFASYFTTYDMLFLGRFAQDSSFTMQELDEGKDGNFPFALGMMHITGSDNIIHTDNAQLILQTIKEGHEQGKRPLLLGGHGGPDGNEWRIESFEANKLLLNTENILNSVHVEGEKSVPDRYSMVLIDSCNESGIHVKQETVDTLGIPIAYTTTIAGVFHLNPEAMAVQRPRLEK